MQDLRNSGRVHHALLLVHVVEPYFVDELDLLEYPLLNPIFLQVFNVEQSETDNLHNVLDALFGQVHRHGELIVDLEIVVAACAEGSSQALFHQQR